MYTGNRHGNDNTVCMYVYLYSVVDRYIHMYASTEMKAHSKTANPTMENDDYI